MAIPTEVLIEAESLRGLVLRHIHGTQAHRETFEFGGRKFTTRVPLRMDVEAAAAFAKTAGPSGFLALLAAQCVVVGSSPVFTMQDVPALMRDSSWGFLSCFQDAIDPFMHKPPAVKLERKGRAK